MNKDLGACTGSQATPGAAEEASPPIGFDPARERVRVILDCEWGDLQHALDMVIAARPSFDRCQNRPGWGWNYSRSGKPRLFVRRTKHGYSATAAIATEAGTAATTEIGAVHEGASPKDIAQGPSQ